MNLDNLIAESVGGLGIYAIFRTSIMAIEAGTSSEAQKHLVDSFRQVLDEYKNRALLQEMNKEAADIAERQRKFEEKWGMLPQQGG